MIGITRKLGRKTAHRNRLVRNLATSLVLHEKLKTTEAKAKALLPVIERLLSNARTGSLQARRTAKAVLFDQNAESKLFDDIIKRLGDRTSGFVRLTKLAPRSGDGAAMAHLELLLTDTEPKEETKAKKATKKASDTKKDDTPAKDTSDESK